MKRRKLVQRESEELIDWLRDRGAWFVRVSPAHSSAPEQEQGAPGFLILGPKARVALMLKSAEAKRLTELQGAWLDRLAGSGWTISVSFGARDAVEFLERQGY